MQNQKPHIAGDVTVKMTLILPKTVLVQKYIGTMKQVIHVVAHVVVHGLLNYYNLLVLVYGITQHTSYLVPFGFYHNHHSRRCFTTFFGGDVYRPGSISLRLFNTGLH